MATEYNPELIQKLADKLYSQANTSIVLGTFIGLIAGGGFGFSASEGSGAAAIVGVLIGGSIGYLIGQSRAFSLRVQAQMALCQRQIELNTRR
jgi:uncharacterized protein YcfJ